MLDEKALELLKMIMQTYDVGEEFYFKDIKKLKRTSKHRLVYSISLLIKAGYLLSRLDTAKNVHIYWLNSDVFDTME